MALTKYWLARLLTVIGSTGRVRQLVGAQLKLELELYVRTWMAKALEMAKVRVEARIRDRPS